MKKQLQLVEVGVLGPFVSFLDEHGVATSRLLDGHNVSPELVARSTGKISKRQLNDFLDNASRSEGIADMGYRVGERHGMRFMGPVGCSVLRAATLTDAVETFAVHLGAYLAGHRLWLEREPQGEFAWLLQSSGDCPDTDSEHAISNQCGVMTLVSLIREAAGSEWCPDHVRMAGAPCDLHRDFEAVERAEVEFRSDGINGVRLPSHLLCMPLQRQIASWESHSSAIPEPAPAAFSEALEAMLRSQLSLVGAPTIGQAAEMVGTSVRSLQRQLAEDGLTYRRLLDRMRFRAARDRLEAGDRAPTVRDLAFDLGFSSASSFVRSFRRVAGATPGEFVRHRIGG